MTAEGHSRCSQRSRRQPHKLCTASILSIFKKRTSGTDRITTVIRVVSTPKRHIIARKWCDIPPHPYLAVGTCAVTSVMLYYNYRRGKGREALRPTRARLDVKPAEAHAWYSRCLYLCVQQRRPFPGWPQKPSGPLLRWASSFLKHPRIATTALPQRNTDQQIVNKIRGVFGALKTYVVMGSPKDERA
jgi:hypothetical protein